MEFLIIIFLILLNGIFSMSEIALVSARKFKLESSAKKGNANARKTLELSKNPNTFLSTAQNRNHADWKKIKWMHFEFEVIDMDGPKIDKVLVSLK